jgi:KaiC/GvpD/RAD55 family RecA-like ATPase
MYDLDGALPTGEPTAVDAGSSIVVAGPAFSGQEDVLFDVLAAGDDHGEGAVVVTTDRSARKVQQAYRDRGGDEERLYVVDARGGGAGGNSGSRRVQTVSSPADLTGIGIRLVQALRALESQGVDRVRIAVHSVSTFVQYLDETVVFQFFHTLTGRVQATDQLLVASLTDGPGDRTLDTVGSAFDVLVQIREQGDGFEARVAQETLRLPWTPITR